MSFTLDKNCIDIEIEHYLAKLSEVKEPVRHEANILDSYRLMRFVKRSPLGVGPYPEVSLFENCNRIFSDLVILFGVRRLLYELANQFPFTEYRVAFGTEQGIDLEAHDNNWSLVGEAFSVAKTFFPTKKRKALNSVLKSNAEYKLLLFNSDAVTNPREWDLRKEQGVFHITIDVDHCVERLLR